MDLSKTQAKILSIIARFPGCTKKEIIDELEITKNSFTSAITTMRNHSLVLKDVQVGYLERPSGELAEIPDDETIDYAVSGKGKQALRDYLDGLLKLVNLLEDGINGVHFVPSHARKQGDTVG